MIPFLFVGGVLLTGAYPVDAVPPPMYEGLLIVLIPILIGVIYGRYIQYTRGN